MIVNGEYVSSQVRCCVCGSIFKTLLVRNGKRICRECYSVLLEDQKIADKILSVKGESK